MIAKLKGIIDSIGEDFVILDVHGVGYLVYCSARTLGALPRPGQPATLAVETQIREDSLKLYGFLSDAEREMFRLLQSVQGVGAKVALAIQAILDAPKLAAAIAVQDKAALSRASGVGPKLAARIVAELRDKVPAFGNAGPVGVPGAKAAPAAVEDAIMVLVNLGYGRMQAVAAVSASAAELGEGAEAAELIRRGLKELSQ
jgi:Holliday junction DNA helicase RuvA